LHVAELEGDRLKALQILLPSLLRHFHFRTRRLFQTQNQRKWDLCFKAVWPLGIEVSQFPDVHTDVFFFRFRLAPLLNMEVLSLDSSLAFYFSETLKKSRGSFGFGFVLVFVLPFQFA